MNTNLIPLVSLLSLAIMPSCAYVHQTTGEEAGIRINLFDAVKNHPTYRAIISRQADPLKREQSVFFWIIKDKSIKAEMGREWPDEPHNRLDTRLTDQEIKDIGQVVREVVASRKIKGTLVFQVVRHGRTVVIYREKFN